MEYLPTKTIIKRILLSSFLLLAFTLFVCYLATIESPEFFRILFLKMLPFVLGIIIISLALAIIAKRYFENLIPSKKEIINETKIIQKRAIFTGIVMIIIGLFVYLLKNLDNSSKILEFLNLENTKPVYFFVVSLLPLLFGIYLKQIYVPKQENKINCDENEQKKEEKQKI